MFGSQKFFSSSTAGPFDPTVDYYSRLDGIKSTATQNEIKLKFYELAKKHHPDTGSQSSQTIEKFKQITEAYEVLSNPDIR